MKKSVLFIVLGCLLVVASVAMAANLVWTKPLPSATTSTMGENAKREEAKAALTEIRTVMEGMAVFSGYSMAGNN